MLVLGRNPGEYVVINGDIKVKVIKDSKGHLRLAIDAPPHVPIVRGEVFEQQRELASNSITVAKQVMKDISKASKPIA